MIAMPFLFVWMLITSVLGLILIAIGKAFRWVLLVFFFYLALFEVSLAEEPKWQLVLIKDAQLVNYKEPFANRRDCIRLGYLYMNDALNEHDDPELDGYFCDRDPPLPVPEKVTAICTAPTRECS